MVTAAKSLASRPYQLPAAALTPLSLPAIGQVIREAYAEAFVQQYGHFVDHQGHAALCREALEGEFVGADALQWLDRYPNTYGLYRLTHEVVRGIEDALVVPSTGLIRGKRKLVERLATPHYDLQLAASATVGCIEAGLLTPADVAKDVVLGSDGAYPLIQKVEGVLDDHLVVPEWASKCITTWIEGDKFVLASEMFMAFHLELPEQIDGAYAEVNTLLFKTLDALSHFFVPFHTPATFMGTHSYHNHQIAEAYDALKDRIGQSTQQELAEYLLSAPPEALDFEIWVFTEDDSDEFDEYSADRAARLLLDMHELTQRCGFHMQRRDAQELSELIAEAQQSAARGGQYSEVLQALVEALNACLERAPTHTQLSEHEYEGSAPEGVGFFESIVVVPSWDFSELDQTATENFNSIVEGIGYLSLPLPITKGRVATDALPILRRTSECLALLDKITTALEGAKNAQP